jgi:hypothetical protein
MFGNRWKHLNWGELVLLLMHVLGGLECNTEHTSPYPGQLKNLDYETEASISHRKTKE